LQLFALANGFGEGLEFLFAHNLVSGLIDGCLLIELSLHQQPGAAMFGEITVAKTSGQPDWDERRSKP
jgi:hypothetical protein